MRASRNPGQVPAEAGDPANALRIGLTAGSAEPVPHDVARRRAATGELARAADAVHRAFFEDRVALLLDAAEGQLDRIRGQARGAVAESAKPGR